MIYSGQRHMLDWETHLQTTKDTQGKNLTKTKDISPLLLVTVVSGVIVVVFAVLVLGDGHVVILKFL